MEKVSLREMMTVALFIALLTALGYVNIPLPFSPVPLTGQTFGVMLAGMLLGSRLGFITLLLFDLTGVIFPVFAGATGGLGKLLGPDVYKRQAWAWERLLGGMQPCHWV